MGAGGEFAESFRYFREHHEESMERMFAAVSDLYAEYWDDFFHFAIFTDENESRAAAFANTHRRYLEALRIGEARKAADLACGRGGFANVLAENTAGDVLGIDISRSQLSHARRYRKPNLRFLRHDVMRIDELGERFDAVSFLDAECYLPDKEKAVEKIARVVNPGGRFLLLAWCRREGLNRTQEELVLHPFMRYWAIPDLATPERYRSWLGRNGLRLLEETDLNHAIRRNWEYGYEQAIRAIGELSMEDIPRFVWKGMKLGRDGLRLIKEQFPAALHIKAGFDSGFLRYVLFLAEKF
ncbi:MAG: methyltransferase domain-containing protein [Deltaproteobacteria bacterium]|nr:methyltransferase domain-containing protein [Deltaproteobacteria bacterium]